MINPAQLLEEVQSPEPEFTMDDDEIVSMVEDELRKSGLQHDSRISQQREQSYKYYYGLPFGNERKGFSRHVSMEVFESVEDVKAELLETFTSGPKVLRFTEEAENDQEAARDATEYVNSIFYDQNRGFNVLHDVIHDGLVAKMGVAKACWYERIRVTPEEFTDVPADALDAMMADPAIFDFEVTDERTEQQMVPTPYGPSKMTQTFVSGTITRKELVGETRVDVIPPENVAIDWSCTDPYEAKAVVITYLDKSKGDLIAEGFDPELLEDLRNTESASLDRNRYARHSIDESFHPDKREGDRERELLDVHEGYFEIDLDGDGIPECWKFTVAGSTLLDKERVERFPLFFWTPYRLPHKAVGMSLADVTQDLQRTASGLIRGVVDNVYLTNTTMKIADLSVIRNPRDLIDNPIGAVINSADPDAVKPVPQPQLNPVTFNAIGLLTEQKASRVGLSKLPAQQVVSHQNSEDMINKLMEEGKSRISIMARGFAETFLKPLLVQIYNIGAAYGQVVGVQSDTGYRVLDPASWKPVRHNMEIAVALTADERGRRAQSLMTTYQTIQQDPSMAPLFGIEEKYNLLTDFFDAIGTGSPRYLKNPKTPAGQQAIQQAAQSAQQKEQMSMQVQMETMQSQLALYAAQIAKMQAETDLKRQKQTADGLIAGAEHKLDLDKFEWDKEMDVKEYELEKVQNRNVSIKGGN